MPRTSWSFAGIALVLTSFVAGEVLINEIHYDPPDKTLLEEFVELRNPGGVAVDLSGWYFSEGISYTFPDGTFLPPGGYLVVAESPERLRDAFGANGALGPFEGQLSNQGEAVTLRDANGSKVDTVDYSVGFPWPTEPSGKGGSLELAHPTLDNDLGGSWRTSSASKAYPEERVLFLQATDATWRYRKGLSEASSPANLWREPGFAEDETWLTGQTSIGFGDDDDRTVLADMMGGYTSVYLRHTFTISAEVGIPPSLLVRLYADDGAIVWINGVEVVRSHVSAGDKAFDAVGRSNEAKWEEFLVGGARSILKPGENLLAIHAFNVSISNNDFSVDAEVGIPSRNELPAAPTPGEENSTLSENVPPQVRQVEHFPATPRGGDTIRITAKATDPQGVASLTLAYQVVPPGGFIPAELPFEPAELMARPAAPRVPNPAFHDAASWVVVPMTDDGTGLDVAAGDSIYTAAIPPQPHRTLVRYRVTAVDTTGLTVVCPYPDDRSLNFALLVYDGVPSFVASKASVHPDGAGHVYPASLLETLPVYHLITRSADVARCVAYNSAWQIPKSNEAARDAYNWEGAFFYEGKVYDHIRYRIRQANDRYGGSGKRSWRFRFNKGRYFEPRDQFGKRYPTKWRTLNTGKMVDNKGVGNFGLTEPLSTKLWNAFGVPAPYMHIFHFRVLDAPDEVPAVLNGQYLGDFWGMAVAVEDYDPRFVDAHKLADGNLYKLKDGVFDGKQLKRNQGRFAVTTDVDFQNIRQQLRPSKDDAWLDDHVNYDRWAHYHAVVEGIRHYDFVPADSHSKNRAWYFEPAEGTEYGRLWTLPWDHDASWGPNWNDGVDYSKNAIFAPPGKPDFKREYRNVIREFRDLVWTEEVINTAIDDSVELLAEFSKADRDRWRGAPSEAGVQDYGPLETKAADMKKFAFAGWAGPSGPTVPAGGRAKHLDNLSNAENDATQIPAPPTVTHVGPGGFPIDQLRFESSAFSDPQGDDSFGSMLWRLAEVTDPSSPAFDPLEPRRFEAEVTWESDEITPFSAGITVPLTVVRPGHTYRLRVRMRDASGRNSHWSAPVQFTAGLPSSPIPVQESLRISEIMYNPAGSGDAEFIELQNVGTAPLDLTSVSFTNGVRFDFAGSAVTSLDPGAFVVVVKNLGVFEARYDTGAIDIAGEFEGKLDNEGDAVELTFGQSLPIQAFTFDDSWLPETDGDGYSLVAVDPLAPTSAWSTSAGWKRSQEVGGSPGRADGSDPPPPTSRQLPGDLTQDGTLNLSDAVAILGHLFQGSPATLPCGGGTFGDRGNRPLADVNGDGTLNLTDAVHVLRYLFLAGDPPALGTECIRMVGCADVCVR